MAQRALDAIHGVDINPYAVAIARFRLLIAAMRASGSDKLKAAPDFHLNLAVGDSLLHGPRHEWQGQGNQTSLLDDPLGHVFEVEDKAQLARILGQRYPVVVGSPPYITVTDKALNQGYRNKYLTCHRQYSLGVPFTERFFDLCLPAMRGELAGEATNGPAGFVGMITANSFMKREFGKKLIEDYLPTKALTHVIDTSGAYIPGHGTPTVILFARNQRPQDEPIRAVLGIRGEPGTPEDAAQGLVWRSIVDLLERPGSENAYVSVVDQARGTYAQHPWSVGGGGATELMELVEDRGANRLVDAVEEIGAVSVIRADDIYDPPLGTLRGGLPRSVMLPHVVGQDVRDWNITPESDVIYPYDESARALKEIGVDLTGRVWPFRILLEMRIAFGKTQSERGLRWFEYSMLFTARFLSRFLVVFPNVATHNHFALIRSRMVVKSKAPVIKLPADATEADHLALLGLLNSSTTCFWMKQVFHNKGEGGGTRVDAGHSALGDEAWKSHFEFAGTGLKAFPIPADPNHPAPHQATHLDQLAQQLANLDPTAVLAGAPEDPAAALATAKSQTDALVRRMIALQEELDWCTYRLYGLTDDDLCMAGSPAEPEPELELYLGTPDVSGRWGWATSVVRARPHGGMKSAAPDAD